MGNKQRKKIDVTEFDPSEWKDISVHRQIAIVVQSKRGRGQAQMQTIPLDPRRDIQKQIQIYQYRKDQDHALIKCLGVVTQRANTHQLCGTSKMLKVLTQRMPLRLNQFPQLSFPQSLYVLSQSLRGYKDCYNKLGSFQISDQMIAVNTQGQVKVWVNEDFAQNHPSVERPVLQTTISEKQGQRLQDLTGRKDESQIIKSIIRLIQMRNESGEFPQQFRDRLYKNTGSFDEAFREIQLFCWQRNMFIPDRLVDLKRDYAYKQALFIPGQQYDSNRKDSLNRQTRQFSFQQSMQPPPRGSRQIPSAVKQSQSVTSVVLNCINSPIKTLHQQPLYKQSQVVPFYQSPMGTKITFNKMPAQISTIVFNHQNNHNLHRI